MNGTLSNKQLQMLQSTKSASSEKKRKALVNDYLEDNGLREKDLKRRRRQARLESLPEEDKGLVYWEVYCEEHGMDPIPTWESVGRYASDFVVPLEEEMVELRRLEPDTPPVLGTRNLIQPVLRLGMRLQSKQQQQHWSSTSRTRVTQLPSPLSIGASDSRSSTPDASSSAMHAVSRLRIADSVDQDQDQHPTTSKSTASLQFGDYSQFKADEFEFLTVGGQLTKFEGEVPTDLYLSEDLRSVGEVLQEWRFGLDGEPSIQENNSKYGGRWRTNQKSLYEMRSSVVMEFVRLVKEVGLSSQAAVQRMIKFQGQWNVMRLGREIKMQRIKRKNARLESSRRQ